MGTNNDSDFSRSATDTSGLGEVCQDFNNFRSAPRAYYSQNSVCLPTGKTVCVLVVSRSSCLFPVVFHNFIRHKSGMNNGSSHPEAWPVQSQKCSQQGHHQELSLQVCWLVPVEDWLRLRLLDTRYFMTRVVSNSPFRALPHVCLASLHSEQWMWSETLKNYKHNKL